MGEKNVREITYRTLIELTNGRWTSALLKKLAHSKASRILVRPFAKFYHINLDEMAIPINEFPTLHDFFIRKLKIDARPICQERNSVISPVDAVLEDFGQISANLQLTVKGKNYSLIDMLGDVSSAEKYLHGTYILLYLSPSHYHRIHSPFSGRVIRQQTLGRKSYPVNKYGLKYGRDALSKNYRKITELEHKDGLAAIVKVGAMFVNSIETIHKDEQLEKGEEMAYFSFGSTVILLFNEQSFIPLKGLHTPKHVKVGETIGYFHDQAGQKKTPKAGEVS